MGLLYILFGYSALALGSVGAAGFWLGRARTRRAGWALLLGALAVFGWNRAVRNDHFAAVLYAERTTYADGFSREGFSHVAVGDGLDVTRRTLGEPLSIVADGQRQLWYYSKEAQAKRSHWIYLVVADQGTKRVTGKSGVLVTE